MIKVDRVNCPGSLNKLDAEFVENDYKNDDVLLDLLTMQKWKCCYCERDLRDKPTTEREVDHYKPRSMFKDKNGNIKWHQANNWLNLLYSCRTCNSRKSQKKPFENNLRVIVDPSDQATDPENHITFDRILDWQFFYKEKNGSVLGKKTIDRIKLDDRRDLKQKFRFRRIEIEKTFMSLINVIEDGDIQGIQELVADLRRAMSSTRPFAAFNRYYIRLRLDELNTRDIPALNGGGFPQIQIQFPTGFEQVL